MDPSLRTRRPLAGLPVFATALALTITASAPSLAVAQDPGLYSEARSQLAAGDTLAALASLREMTEAEPDFAAGWGLLGRVLTERASGVATDFRERQEADRALRRALALDPDHPLYLLALGQLMRKQQMYVDAQRVLGRASEAMQRSPDRLPPEERAELWFQRGLFYEDAYLDTRGLMFVPDLPVQSPDCGIVGTFCLNFVRPKDFNEYFRHAGDLSEDGDDDFERTLDAFRRALEAYPAHDAAFRRLTIHLVDRGDYAEALRLARRYRAEAPDSPWGYFTLGLICQRTGRDSLAEVEFDRGLELAPPNIAAHYRDISPLLRATQAESYQRQADQARQLMEGIVWRKSDPLYLTPGNEVRVAHLARVTYADLMFEDPSEGVWGAETEQGVVYVRYGAPQRIWQVHRNAAREESDPEAQSSVQGGGRWIFWNYGWELPNFIFQKQLRWRHASHILSGYSKAMEEEVREAIPAVYSTSFDLFGHPLQLARFRGAADTIIELDVYSEVPADELLSAADSLEVGFFLFTGAEHQEIYRRALRIASPPRPQALTYSLPLLAGRYTYSVEARAASGKAAVRRAEVELEPFLDGVLALSDIVLANSVAPRTQEPTRRRDFAINVNRRFEFDPDLPLAIYWEVYGLSQDEGGFAHYQVTLSVSDAEGGGVLARVTGALGRLFGLSGEEALELTYERLVELSGDRVPEYMTMEFADSEPGEYRVRVQVTDQLSGASVVGERTFTVTGL